MKVGIIQPYFSPYIGYFQILNAVDIFVFYDDVNFIKRGWINRNKIAVNGEDFNFTVPLMSPSSFRKIKETKIKYPNYQIWKNKFLSTLNQNYRKAQFYNEVLPVIHGVISQNYQTINELAKHSIIAIVNYLQIETKIVWSSEIYCNNDLKGSLRIIDICSKVGATEYYNSIGGIELYNKNQFLESGIDLKFLEMQSFSYPQLTKDFHPSLSIIDILMNVSKGDIIKELLDKYKIIE